MISMISRAKWLRVGLVAAAGLLTINAGVARGQGGPGGPPPPGGFHGMGMGPMGADDAMGFIGFQSGLSGKTVTGAPFTAEFSTETTQTLADGNVIDRKTTGSFARDGQGRTRRDVTLPAIGAFATSENGGAPPHGVFINDPVAGTSYIIDPNRKVARQMELRPNQFGKNGDGPQGNGHRNASNLTTQSLGTQNIGGVTAEGTRTIRTIPAGQIGNEKPIAITVDRWYSADLQTNVLIKRTGPEGGVTTFQLANIVRSEPDASLFQVPSDYTVKQGGGGRRHGMNHGDAPPPAPPQ